MNETKKKTAYKEPWFWAVMGPLLVVIVVSLSMAGVAIWVADDRVKDEYYKEGRMINKHFAEEELALAQAVRGSLEFDFTTAEVFAELDAETLPMELELSFSHPASAEQDVTVVMQRIAEGRYRADLPALAQGRWYLIIGNRPTSADDRWRVTTEIDFRHTASAQFNAHL